MRRKRDERGSMMVEAVVAMFIILLVTAGVLQQQISHRKVNQHVMMLTAVDQYVSGLMEETKTIPWDQLVSCRPTPRAQNFPADAETIGSTYSTPMDVSNADCPPRGIPYARTETINGYSVTFYTTVNWHIYRGNPRPRDGAAGAGDYGRKITEIRARWTLPGRPQTSTLARSARSSTLSEAARW